jgi:hypothetical protein
LAAGSIKGRSPFGEFETCYRVVNDLQSESAGATHDYLLALTDLTSNGRVSGQGRGSRDSGR